MFVIQELLYRALGSRERKKEYDTVLTILKYVTSAQVEDIMICTERC
jgi:hypothetical protein